MSGVIFSSSAVAEGETYTLVVDGETVEQAQAALGTADDTGMGGQPDARPDEGGTAGYTDVAADAWYADAVAYVSAQGLMIGTSSGAFSPDTTMSRAMLVTVLYRLSGVAGGLAGGQFYRRGSGCLVCGRSCVGERAGRGQRHVGNHIFAG